MSLFESNLEFATGSTLPVHVKWMGFGTKQRLDFYEILRVLLENNRALRDSLGQILQMELEGSSRPSPYAQCISMIIEQLDAGMDFDVAIKPLVPLTEAQLIRSGHRTADVPRALGECIAALESGSKMLGSVVGAAVYPVGMLAIFYFILGIFAQKVIPPFEKLIPPDNWEGFAGIMHSMVEIFRAAGPAIALAIAAIVVLIIVTLPTYWGALESLRNVLDKHVPPWSIYRMTAGTAFLKTLAAQARASMKIDLILSEMAMNSSPWLRTRIDAIAEGMAAGKTLGDAMADSGYDFPDRRAVKIMKTLSTSEGFETSVSSFAIRWEEATVKKVQAAAKLSVVGSTLAMGMLTGVLFMGIQELTDQVEQQSSEVQSKV